MVVVVVVEREDECLTSVMWIMLALQIFGFGATPASAVLNGPAHLHGH